MELDKDAETAGLRGAKVKRETFATQFRQASTSADSKWGILTAIGALLCASVGCTFALLICNAIPVAMIVMGSLYFDESWCTAEPIALLLVIGGVGKMIRMIFATFTRKKSPEDEQNGCIRLFSSLLDLFLFCWFIATCVIVYRLHSHVSYDSTSATEDYCHKTLYLFSFWYLNALFIVIGLCFFLGCCLLCCGASLAASQ